MKKKLNLFAAIILTMTLIFGSTLCYAAEGEETENIEAVERHNAVARSINTQTSETTKTVNLGSTGIIAYVTLNYSWDEGYTGWFNSASIVGTYVPSGTQFTLMDFAHSATGNSSYITVTIKYICNGVYDVASRQFYVDEYGELY